MWKSRNAEILHTDNVWRCRCRSTPARVAVEDTIQGWVVIRNNDTNHERTHDEKDSKSPVNSLEGVLDVDAWPLGFGSDHRDVFRADDGERCGPETCQEALKPTFVASG